MSTNNPMQALHAQIAYYGITHAELALMTKEQLLNVISGKADLLEELFGALIVVEHEKFDAKLARHREQAEARALAQAEQPATTH